MKQLSLNFLQGELNRVSDWVRYSDRKSAFLSVYYTAIFGILISQKDTIISNLSIYDNFLKFFYSTLILSIIFSSLIGIFFLLNSIFPRLRSPNTDKSIFFFGNIANMKFIDYLKEIENLTDTESKKKIIEQIFTNSLIADQKMKNIQKSTLALIVLIFSALLLIFI